jgi:hypothetical protein
VTDILEHGVLLIEYSSDISYRKWNLTLICTGFLLCKSFLVIFPSHEDYSRLGCSVSLLPRDYTALYPRGLHYLTPWEPSHEFDAFRTSILLMSSLWYFMLSSESSGMYCRVLNWMSPPWELKISLILCCLHSLSSCAMSCWFLN